MIVKDRILLEPLIEGMWKLHGDIHYVWDGVRYTVPSGFIFDGASIPRVARLIIPKNGVKIYAALIHDYLYREGDADKATADKIFRDVLIEKGERKWKVLAMYNAVRIFGRPSVLEE